MNSIEVESLLFKLYSYFDFYKEIGFLKSKSFRPSFNKVNYFLLPFSELLKLGTDNKSFKSNFWPGLLEENYCFLKEKENGSFSKDDSSLLSYESSYIGSKSKSISSFLPKLASSKFILLSFLP